MSESRLFVTPRNDGEAVAIIEMLEKNGEQFLVTGQAWGASWDGLEEDIKEKIEKAKQDGIEVIGVELQGDSHGATNIDHHVYGEDDRSNPKASIEQVADKIGAQLTLEERFVAANDKGYIPAMEKLGEELGITGADLETIIQNVRMKDRMAQGITLEQEEQAKAAIEPLGDLAAKRSYIEINLPHSKTATVTDRLYGKYDELLIISGDGESNFYGSTETINMLNEKFPGGWSGGQLDQENGFWGGYVDQNALREALREYMDEKYNHQNKHKHPNDQSDNFGDDM